MPTIRQALEKVSELKSRRAILEVLMLYLDANYVDDDSGEAEMNVVRDDAAVVPQQHIKEFQAWLVEQSDIASSEIDEWEDMQLLPPVEEKTDEPEPKPKRKRPDRARAKPSS